MVKLKRIHDIGESDLDEHPIWICVHGHDEREPWYASTDETTFRPWDKPLPFQLDDPNRPQALIDADFRLADGRTTRGFVFTPMSHGGFGDLQPSIFVAGGKQKISLYAPIRRLAIQRKSEIESSFAAGPGLIFPIQFQTRSGLVSSTISKTASGIYFRESGSEKFV